MSTIIENENYFYKRSKKREKGRTNVLVSGRADGTHALRQEVCGRIKKSAKRTEWLEYAACEATEAIQRLIGDH